MTQRARLNFRLFSVGILTLAVLFFLFFDQSKHAPSLAAVNPFNVDPFDAVGSFGVLLALFVGMVTVVRAFRPYRGEEIPPGTLDLILRGALVVILCVAVTLAADAIAVARHLGETLALAGGRALVGLMALLAILNGLMALWLAVRMRDVSPARTAAPWARAFGICATCAAFLAVYPPAWDEGVGGGILTALAGTLILFAAVWALATRAFPRSPNGDDLLDDLTAIYDWTVLRLGRLASFFDGVERLNKVPWVRSLLDWLNPRRHPWNLAVAGGIVLGAALASAEALGEGVSPQAGRFVLVAGVFVGLATAGVLVGYGFLGRFLRIFRREAATDES